VYGRSNGRAIIGESLSAGGQAGAGVVGSAIKGTGVIGSCVDGNGIVGVSGHSVGVWGAAAAATSPGVYGESQARGTGVLGFSKTNRSSPRPTARARTGVFGYAAQDTQSRGVVGRSPRGQGVRGEATSGVGVFGAATTGFAFRGAGRVQFTRVSGVATIATGNVSVLVKPGVDVTSSSFVLLTPRVNLGSRGLWYTTNPTANSLTIHMSSSRAGPAKVAWLLLG
jgi:hypothetical protein